jgi:hypothetical protein
MIVTVTFHWSDEHGPCTDCSAPAAFLSVNAYGIGAHRRLCSVCAANDAADGCTIVRIAPDDVT